MLSSPLEKGRVFDISEKGEGGGAITKKPSRTVKTEGEFFFSAEGHLL